MANIWVELKGKLEANRLDKPCHAVAIDESIPVIKDSLPGPTPAMESLSLTLICGTVNTTTKASNVRITTSFGRISIARELFHLIHKSSNL
jgi:hypothetical protein